MLHALGAGVRSPLPGKRDRRDRDVQFCLALKERSVIDKRVKNNEHVADLKVSCKNQDGLQIISGTATVRLLSREGA
ncbi:MAG: hypothetical protein ACFFD2_06395 [Promethearchaeota archaeon]